MPLRLKRLFRFSLRTVFVLVTILCVALGIKVRRVCQQRESVEWVLAQGGVIAYEHETPATAFAPFPAPNLPGPECLRTWLGDDYFVTPYVVWLGGDAVEDVSPLQHLPTLRCAIVCSRRLVDVAPLENLQALRTLYLKCHEDCDLSPLKNLRHLKKLYVLSAGDEDIDELRTALPRCEVSNKEEYSLRMVFDVYPRDQ